MGPGNNQSASDTNVGGTVLRNAGAIQPGRGEEVNVAILGVGVVIDAVVVKGGPAYNVYSNAAFLPPTLPPNQHYISPLNGGGNVPDISHWFVCYHLTTPPPLGSLTVLKTVVPPNGVPIEPLPTTFSALVNCNDGNPAHENVTVTFSRGGGRAGGPTLIGIPAGTVCTVVEQGSLTFPPGSTVSYTPTGADNPGVTIVADTVATVTITNNFSAVTIQTESLQLAKVVVPGPPGVTMPAGYTAHVSCDDGTEVDVTFPAAGGNGTPVPTVKVGALCAVAEDTTALPPGWVVTYAVAGGPPSSTPPTFVVTNLGTVVVTITNDPTAVPPTTTHHHDDH